MMATTKTQEPRTAIAQNVKLTKALTHPLRIQIMELFEREPAAGKKQVEWSPSKVAEELKAPLGNVSYHMRILGDLGFIRVARRQPRRGAIEHHYVKVAKSGWDSLPGAEGAEVELGTLRSFLAIHKSVKAETKIGILVDGDELVLKTGDAAWRVPQPDTLTMENGAGDGSE
jgi:DNA-binding transcriptional ArsR family regulator